MTASESGPGAEVARRITEWRRRRRLGNVLDLSGLGLHAFPESLRTLQKVRFLKLTQNEIAGIPRWIGELSRLNILALAFNRIEAIPPEISALRHLKFLSLAANRLRSLPVELLQPPLDMLDALVRRELEALHAEMRAQPGRGAGVERRRRPGDIFLFIASQSSMVRPYIKDPELRRAKERRDAGEIEIVAVKLEPCACDDDPVLGKLHRLASKFKSIAEAPLKSAGWEQVRKDLLPVITRVREKKEGGRGPRSASKGRAVGTSLRRGRSSIGPALIRRPSPGI